MKNSIYDVSRAIELSIIDRRKLKKLKRKLLIVDVSIFTSMGFSSTVGPKRRYTNIIIDENLFNCNLVISNKHFYRNKCENIISIRYCDIEFINSIDDFYTGSNKNNKLYMIFQTENDYLKWKLKQ